MNACLLRSAACSLTCVALFLALGCAATAVSNNRVDPPTRTFENDLLRIRYGADTDNEGLMMTGITEFIYKPTGADYASTLDAHGYGYAKYHTGGVALERKSVDDDLVEVEIRCHNGVDVVKRNRLFTGLAVLEIEYEKLEIIWWEDFYSTPTENRVYSIYGLEKELDKTEHARLRKAAEEAVGHNHGDAFLKAAGVTPEDVYYKAHFIFGFYDRRTGRGLGFVQPALLGLHDGWKLWSMYNYECFPFLDSPGQLPLKRWIFVVTGGREGLFKTGKAICDAAAEGKPITSTLSAAP